MPEADRGTETVYTELHCVSLTSCVMIGDSTDTTDSGGDTPLAASWNGTAFTELNAPQPAGVTEAELNDVSCTSAVRCIAVGDHGTDKSGTPAALAWNGSKWTLLKVAGPGTGKAAAFEAVSCPVSGKCMTTGTTGEADYSTGTPIAGYWNGRAWKYGPMLPAAAA